ncbi:hypothetical protein J6TS7_21030 [Paenibacillus dendritiformis]|uniref:hypothetical protein n=1 Tax=Paenibacillus TaxID=44249 RepID=UPI001B152F6D|nr:hypothetical protein [Paenibacillus dendritiformis]GIO78493.1 hypothetical protein J6TS7_21030 [Paenibacillus dendritiformis]
MNMEKFYEEQAKRSHERNLRYATLFGRLESILTSGVGTSKETINAALNEMKTFDVETKRSQEGCVIEGKNKEVEIQGQRSVDESYYREIFEMDKDKPFPTAIQLIQKVTESGLPLQKQERAIAVIQKIAKEYHVEISGTAE